MDYTHYDFLDLPPGASAARIEAAYQTIKQRLNSDSDEQMIRMIHEAYTVLSDTDRREQYDTELQRIAAAADAELKSALDNQASRPARRVQDVPMTLLTAVSAWAA
jgi:curved DNA-binding protein CbpA